ncbi:MAG: HepT-like ribonuclease domain-containing protein [Desulfomonilaceae bacterium]
MQDAVMRNFEIIGEGVSHLPDEIKSLYHDTELGEIVGFRNILAHGYFVIKLETVWSAIEEGLPNLEKQTKAILGGET